MWGCGGSNGLLHYTLNIADYFLYRTFIKFLDKKIGALAPNEDTPERGYSILTLFNF